MSYRPVIAAAPRALNRAAFHELWPHATVVTIADLCRQAGVQQQVTGYREPAIGIIPGDAHYRYMDTRGRRYYILGADGVPEEDRQDIRATAVRLLEILAYSFNDYCAREAMRCSGLFIKQGPTATMQP